VKTLYPAVGLQSVSEEACVFIADLNVSKLWQAETVWQQTEPAQSNADNKLPTDTPVIWKIFLYAIIASEISLQCFDAVGWVAGRASGL